MKCVPCRIKIQRKLLLREMEILKFSWVRLFHYNIFLMKVRGFISTDWLKIKTSLIRHDPLLTVYGNC